MPRQANIGDDIINNRVLVTNDDGISSPGIKLLYEVACSLFSDVWVVAPASEQSGKGHSLTLQAGLEVRNTSAVSYTHLRAHETPEQLV